MTLNNHVAMDDPTNPNSPNYVEKRQEITIYQCPDCCDYYDEDGCPTHPSKFDDDFFAVEIIPQKCHECKMNYFLELTEND